MRWPFLLSFLALTCFSFSAAAQNRQSSHYFSSSIPDKVETGYDSFMNFASSLAGAPNNGRALEAGQGHDRLPPGQSRYETSTTMDRKDSGFSSAPAHVLTPPSPQGFGSYESPTYAPPIITPEPAHGLADYGTPSAPNSPPVITPSPAKNFSEYETAPPEIVFEKSANSDYDESRSSGNLRRELTAYEKSVIYNQKPVYALFKTE